MPVTHVSLPLYLVERTLGYLSTQPFKDVAQLINEMKTTADASFAEQTREANQGGHPSGG